jgi:hypothetical protein
MTVTDEERAAFKRSELESMYALFCPNDDRYRKALADILSLSVDHLDDGRMRVIHKAAMRGLGER